MAINLIKGQRVEIESGLTRLKVEMGWKVNPNAEPAYDLDEDFSIETAVEFGRLYRHNGEWKFEAIGNGNKGGLQALVNKYAKQFA